MRPGVALRMLYRNCLAFNWIMQGFFREKSEKTLASPCDEISMSLILGLCRNHCWSLSAGWRIERFRGESKTVNLGAAVPNACLREPQPSFFWTCKGTLGGEGM